MDKQSEVLKYLLSKEVATKKEIYENVSFSYYHNWQKHLGDVLSRMVKNGKIERVKPGVFKAVRGGSPKPTDKENPDQLKLDFF